MKTNPISCARREGSALVITLAFLVLLTVLVLAFFSRALTERQVSNTSAAQIKADLLARGAADMIVADLKEEIRAGSLPTAAVPPVYLPASNANIVPQQSGVPSPSPTPPIPNLVRRSVRDNSPTGANPMPLPGVPSRASAVNSTTDPSPNGRSIPLARWNSHYLIPRHNTGTAIDSTPISPLNASSPEPYGFIPPDWVMVTTNGPQVLTEPLDPAVIATVIGRYAYAIYDEGGLLDANVAGYPSALTAIQAAFKGSTAFADLTQLPTSGNGTFPSSQVDNLVGWRNYASAQPTGTLAGNYAFDAAAATRYCNSVISNSTGFLSVNPRPSPSPATSASRTDQMFTSRQALLRFRRATGFSQNALQYLTTFSRDLNQPSVAPPANRPSIVSGIGTVSGVNYYSDYGGGNSGNGNDDRINPSFLAKTVATPFTRKDGTTAAVGEQLVKKRFPLECLAWITCKGPSASRSPYTDADMVALLSKPGVTKDLLDRGTPENIRNYFGLVWDSTDHLWNYAPGAYGSPLATAPVAGPVQLLEYITGREPNFIELLKATIAAGSLGKSLGGGEVGQTDSPTSCYFVSTGVQAIHLRDSSIDAHVIQIAANIIEQAAVDGYPKRIRFDDSVKKRIFAGVENLPYFYGWRNVALKLADSVPSTDPPPWTTVPTGSPTVTVTTPTADPGDYGRYNVTSTRTGVGVELIVPEIWNPHDPNSATGVIRPGAGELRVVADAIIDIPDVASITNGLPGASPISSMNLSLKDASQPFSGGPDPFILNPNTSALVFGDNNGLLFREPTALRSPNIPAGSNLAVAGTHELQVLRSTLNSLAGNTAVAADGSLTDFRDATNKYLGILVGYFPLAWFTGWQNSVFSNALIKTTRNSDGTYTQKINGVRYDCNYNQPEMTFRVQCKDAYGNWVDYDTKYWSTPYEMGSGYRYWTAQFDPDVPGRPWVRMNNLIGYFCHGRAFDPRTSRFGIASANWYGINFVNGAPLDPSGTQVAWDTWATQKANALGSTFYSYQKAYYNSGWSNHGPKFRVAANAGFNFGSPAGSGEIQRGYPLDGILTQNNPQRTNYYDDPSGKFTGSGYYTDADGVIRRAMGAYSSPGYSSGSTTSDTGLPTSTATANWNSSSPTATAQSQSRPVILHRPFRSVAELGFVFRDFPWKNLDFFTPESGDAALLDVFCIRDNSNSDGLVAGKVNLNTRQAPVLQAILAGAYKDEQAGSSSPPGWQINPVAASESATLANLLVTRSTSAAAGKGPLRNVSELVGAWVSGAGTNAVYDGFSKDIPTGSGAAQVVQRFRESAIRPLANCGQTRVWNLMIDIVAQSGRFPANAASLDQFVVEGEQHRWVHLAIDRLTGKVLDLQIEPVNE